MPATLTYPGVYIEEIPSGVRTVTGVASSITAFVGYTMRGDLNKAVRIQNFGDFERQYGGLNRDSLVSYSVKQFFLNGGSDAYVVRVSKGSEIAKITLKDHSGTPVLHVMAYSPGIWGNEIGLDVDYNTRNPESEFNLIVTRYETRNNESVPAEVERHINLSMNASSPTYAVDVVKTSSKLINLERIDGLNFVEKGWCLSGNLSTLPDMSECDENISGVLNGDKPFTIRLASIPVDISALFSVLNDAITVAGLANQIIVNRANARGEDSQNGNFIKLVANGDPASNERSSIEIFKSPSKTVANKIKLGLANGGRERDGSSLHRPVVTGTSSGDLSDILDLNAQISGSISISVMNKGSLSEILSSTIISIESINPGPDLPMKLQEAIRDVKNPSTKGAIVQLSGPFLRIVTSADTPNAVISIVDPLNLLFGTNAYLNVQQYRLGTGISYGAQIEAVRGLDGGLPTATEILGKPIDKTGIYALEDVDLFNILCIPETSIILGPGDPDIAIISEATAFCEQRRAFFIIDPNPRKSKTDIAVWSEKASVSRNAAVFFPQIRISDPLNEYRFRDMPPSGAIAGIFARTDSQRGIWKAPAGTEAVVNGAQDLSQNLTDMENGPLNQKGVNCIRSFPVYGIIAWGARTRSGADEMADEYKYIPIRRLALYLEESLYRGLKWVVFEPNDEPLWSQIRLNVGAFMQNLFRQGAFQGKTPHDAYFVKCDKETTTQTEVNLGIVNVMVGFAPLKPAEFVVIKIQQMAGQIQT